MGAGCFCRLSWSPNSCCPAFSKPSSHSTCLLRLMRASRCSSNSVRPCCCCACCCSGAGCMLLAGRLLCCQPVCLNESAAMPWEVCRALSSVSADMPVSSAASNPVTTQLTPNNSYTDRLLVNCIRDISWRCTPVTERYRLRNSSSSINSSNCRSLLSQLFPVAGVSAFRATKASCPPLSCSYQSAAA